MYTVNPIKPLLCCLFLFCAGCGKGHEGPDNPGNDYTSFTTAISGFSGLCFNSSKTGFFAVSDNGSIYEINTDGSTIRQLSYSGNNDFEAISLNPATGKLYVADESLMNIYWLLPDQVTLNLVTHISISNGISNKGIEGLTYGNDTLYIVNQESPTLLIKYSLPGQTETERITIGYAGYLSDICFDNSDNSLWICDSRQQLLYHCRLNGELIASQEISFIPKAEALLIDRAAGLAWIGCDQGSKLYRVPLKI